MRLIDDIKHDVRTARKMRLSWRGLLGVMAGSLVLCRLCDHFGRLDLAMPLMMSACALGFVLALKRTWTRRTWFWIAMAFAVALQVELILWVPWPTEWIPARSWAGAATIDFVAITLILDIVGRIAERGAPPADAGAARTSHVGGMRVRRRDGRHHG
jgi:hypothetical protein